MELVSKLFERTFSQHPYVFLLVILLTGASVTHSYNVFAQKATVKEDLEAFQLANAVKFTDIEQKISMMEYNVLIMFSKQAVLNYSSEIHTLSELDRAGKANSRDRERLQDLKLALDAELSTQSQTQTQKHLMKGARPKP